MIQGYGPQSPLAFIIADAPHGEDFKTNYALSGYDETLLKQLLKDGNGPPWEKFYKTCLIKTPEDAKLGWPNSKELQASQECLPRHSNILINEINALNPFLLIPTGELSFNYLTGYTGIRKFRGSVLMTTNLPGLNKPIKVMPILGPYPYLHQDYKMRYISRIDVSKICKYLSDAPPPDDVFRIWVARTSSALRTFFERSYTEDGLLVFDIETFINVPTCISFCFDGFESVCVPLLDRSIDLDNRVLMMDLVARMLNSKIPKVNQNVKFDWKTMEDKWGFKVRNVVGDTMLAASCIYGDFPKNLGFLTSIYTDLPYFKDEGKEFDPLKFKKEQFYLYNAKDSLATHQIYKKQMPELKEQGVEHIYEKLIKLIPIYKTMENNGIRIDQEQRESLIAKYESLYDIHVRELRIMTGNHQLNPLSSAQIQTLVFEELGFKAPGSISRSIHGADEESLLLLMTYGEATRSPQFGKEILQEVITCRKIHKVLEILELDIWPDGRFRCEFNLSGTNTGRTAAGKSTDYILKIEKGKTKATDLGHSLQTIGKHGFFIDGIQYGKDIRSMYVPSRGHVFVENDLSQAEARVDAVLAGNFDILSIFDGPIGIHRLTGSWVFNCKPEDIKKNTLEYHMAKTVRHAGERNMKEDRMVAMTQQPAAHCKRVLETFHKKQPEIQQVYHRDVMTAMNTTRCLIAPHGRRYDFFDRFNQHVYNQGISFLPQVIVSDQTKFALIKIMEECPWARLLTEQHDGVLAEVPKAKAMVYAESYRRNVQTPIDFRTGSLKRDYQLIIPCESAIGDDWQHLLEIK